MKYNQEYEEYTLLMGKGFALNVYLPALLETRCKNLVLESSSKNNIKPGLINQDIKWIEDGEILNHKFAKIIIVEPPKKQFELVCEKSIWKNSNKFILEKPLCHDHKKAKYLVDKLNENKIKYSINYTFRYTKWYSKVCNYLHNNIDKEEINVVWNFNGRHINKDHSTWKTNHFMGGGVIKYYGIHLIAILSDIGYLEINKINIFSQPKNSLKKWYCQLNSTSKLPKLNLYIDSNSKKQEFFWYQQNKHIIKLENPFYLETTKYLGDKRIPPVIKFLNEKRTNLCNSKNMNVLELWCKIESLL